MSALAQIDPKHITFGAKDGKFAKTSLDGALVKFVMGSVDAPLRAPFGVSEPYNGEPTDRLTMDLELDDPTLLKRVRALDELVIAAAVKHSVTWFGKQMSEDKLRAMHNPLVKDAKTDGYPPMVRTKVSVGLKAPTKIFLSQKGSTKVVLGSRHDVARGGYVTPHVTMSSVMFGNKQFGVSLTVENLMVKPGDDAEGVSVFGDFELEEGGGVSEPPAKKAKTIGDTDVESEVDTL